MKSKKLGSFTTLTKIGGDWVLAGRDPFPPEPDRMNTDPTSQDRQINPNPTIDWMSERKFYVRDLVRPGAGPDWSHTLTTECEYCNKTVEIHLRAPLNVAKFAKDEACRLVRLEHLRIEHPKPKPLKKKIPQ